MKKDEISEGDISQQVICFCHHVTVFPITGVKQGEACTVVLRGATKMIVDEAERSLHDALCVLTQTVKETRTVFGGGWLV